MISKNKTYRFAYLLASYMIGLFLLSGCYKIFFPSEFSLAVYRFHLLPDFWINITALYLAWLEFTCAICLLFISRYRVAALIIAFLLLSIFTYGIIINLLRGTHFGCGCFSPSPLVKPMSGLNVIRNGALLLLVGLALFSHKKSLKS